MPLRKFTADVNVQQYAEKLCSDKKNGQYVKLIPLQQLESVLGKIKTAGTKQDKPVSRLEPLELPSPASRRGKLQPLSPRSIKDDQTPRKNDENGLKPKHGSTSSDASLNSKINKDSTSHPREFNDAMNNERKLVDKLLTKQDDPQIGVDETSKSDSLQLPDASIPSEISEGDEDEDFENLTEEGILEKLIALPSNSDDENDLNKVSEDVLKQKKKEMDKGFEWNQLKPGEEGYEYDKEVDFDGDDKVSCGWDSSNSEIEYF